MNLPEDYQNKMQKMLGGDEYLQYLDSFNYSYGQTLRVNQLKEGTGGFIRRFLLDGQVSWCSTDFIMRANRNYPPIRIIMQECIIYRNRVRWHCRFFTSRTRR